MPRLSELSLYNRFKWAVPVVPDVSEPFFAQPKPWDFPQPVLELIEQMFEEIEEFYTSMNLPVDVVIYEIKEVFGYLDISNLCPHREVTMIFEKYKELSKEFFS